MIIRTLIATLSVAAFVLTVPLASNPVAPAHAATSSEVAPTSGSATSGTNTPLTGGTNRTSDDAANDQPPGATGEKPAPPKPEALEPEDLASEPGPTTGKDAPGPATVGERDRILEDLYKRLAKADNADYARLIQTAIEKMWSFSGSDTIDLLMQRAQAALGQKNNTVAVTVLNAVVGLEPAYAEGWARRAFVHFSNKDYQASLNDLRRVLVLDPKHFKAIGGLAVILREYGRDAAALGAFRKALEINPHDEETIKAVKDLEVEVEGQPI